LNKFALPGVVWFASDLHLGSQTPGTCDAFTSFLEAAADEANALLLVGDIFDAWIGDDIIQAAPPWLVAVQGALSKTTARMPVWLGRGNRDFLMGQVFADSVGAHLLPDTVILTTDGGDVLLSHGDEYCTDDIAYQQFRTMVRNPQWQTQFLAHSIPQRLAQAARVRSESMAANQAKSADIMDVNPDAVTQAFRDTGVALMIHGHTHRPARHVLSVDGQRCERWVLPDWDYDHAGPPRGGWLVLDRDGPALYDLTR